MLKFLRKYNKWILVIGGSLLMVAFLAPQAIQQLPKLRDKTVARYDGEPVKASEIQLASDELRAIDAIGGRLPVTDVLLTLTAPNNERDVEWYLLSREAEEAGFVGSDQDGVTLYPLIAQQLAMAEVQYRMQQFQQRLTPLQQQQLAAQLAPQWQERLLANESNAAGAGRFRTLEELRRTFAKLHGVLRMTQAFERVPRYSSSRATRAGKETFSSAVYDYLVIPADRFIQNIEDPSEEAIQAHFEQYKDKMPSETDYGIGYLQPQRLKLEWLVIDRTGIENAITIDPVEASKYQQLNKDRFPGTFTQEKPNVEAVLRRETASGIMDQIENIVQAEMLSATRTIEQEGGYYVLPEDWSDQRLDLETLAQTIVEKVADSNEGLTIPAPTVERRADTWHTQQDILMLPDIGFSSIQIGSQQIPFYQGVFAVRELNPNLNLPIQTGVLASAYPFTGPDGSRYFFRVLDSRDVSPPESVDEVREEIVTDIKRIAAYEELLSELPNYAEVAASAGLEAVQEAVNAGLPEPDEEGAEDAPARVQVRESVTLRSRVGQTTPAVFRDEDVLKAAYDVSRPLDPTRDIESVPLAERTFHAPAPKSLAVVVGHVDGLAPLTAESFASSYDQLKSMLTQLEVIEIEERAYPFSYENLLNRHNFEDLSGRLVASRGDASTPADSAPADDDDGESEEGDDEADADQPPASRASEASRTASESGGE